MSNSLQVLLSCNNHAGDHFSRPGGSGRYQGFIHWHIPALVLLVSAGETGSGLMPEAMWRDTDQLPTKMKSMPQDEFIPKNAFLQFKEASNPKLSKLNNSRDLKGWNYFLAGISPFWSSR